MQRSISFPNIHYSGPLLIPTFGKLYLRRTCALGHHIKAPACGNHLLRASGKDQVGWRARLILLTSAVNDSIALRFSSPEIPCKTLPSANIPDKCRFDDVPSPSPAVCGPPLLSSSLCLLLDPWPAYTLHCGNSRPWKRFCNYCGNAD